MRTSRHSPSSVEWLTSCCTSGRKSLALLTAALISVGGNVTPIQAAPNPATPIQHLVVVFQENVSFDHYFGTYPNAANLARENAFQAKPNTPTINGLSIALLQHNPNLNPSNAAGATNPFRLSPSQAVTAVRFHFAERTLRTRLFLISMPAIRY